MSEIKLLKANCTEQKVDAIVNAANNMLFPGGGICGAIFKKAGYEQLMEACKVFNTPLKAGEAVSTQAYDITNTKIIIHAVGPDFRLNKYAYHELKAAYYNSLLQLVTYDYHSIAFPLISAGIYAGELENAVSLSTHYCQEAYADFKRDYPDYNLSVYLCAYTEDEFEKAKKSWFM